MEAIINEPTDADLDCYVEEVIADAERLVKDASEVDAPRCVA